MGKKGISRADLSKGRRKGKTYLKPRYTLVTSLASVEYEEGSVS